MTADSTDDPQVPIVCEVCDTASRVPLSTLPESLDRHNERLHDGEAHARVDPTVADLLADFVARDLGLLDDPDSPR